MTYAIKAQSGACYGIPEPLMSLWSIPSFPDACLSLFETTVDSAFGDGPRLSVEPLDENETDERELELRKPNSPTYEPPSLCSEDFKTGSPDVAIDIQKPYDSHSTSKGVRLNQNPTIPPPTSTEDYFGICREEDTTPLRQQSVSPTLLCDETTNPQLSSLWTSTDNYPGETQTKSKDLPDIDSLFGSDDESSTPVPPIKRRNRFARQDDDEYCPTDGDLPVKLELYLTRSSLVYQNGSTRANGRQTLSDGGESGQLWDSDSEAFDRSQAGQKARKISGSKSNRIKCPNCPGKTFTRRADLDRHLKSSCHNGKASIKCVCGLCGRELVRPDALRRHMISHNRGTIGPAGQKIVGQRGALSVLMGPKNSDESSIGFAKQADRDGDVKYVDIYKIYSFGAIRLDSTFSSRDLSIMSIDTNENAPSPSEASISPVATRFRSPPFSDPLPPPSSARSNSASFSPESSAEPMEPEEGAYAPLNSIASKYGVPTADIVPPEFPINAAQAPGGEKAEDASESFRMPTLKPASWGKDTAGNKQYTPPFSGGTISSVAFPPPGKTKPPGRASLDGSSWASTSRRATTSSASTSTMAEPADDDRDSWKTGWSRPQAPRSLRPRPESTPGRIMQPKAEPGTPEMQVSGDEGGESEVDELEDEVPTSPSKVAEKGKDKPHSKFKHPGRVSCLKGCGKTFARFAEARRHSEQTTGCGGGEKAFLCERCGSSFTRSDALSRHARPRGSGKLTSCDVKYDTLMRQRKAAEN
ncbi:hypothetical protein HWV62_42812 [Athelia sp. TMB]|nr:hypothetical protein HWV62_42812 [Athelia sp. TMB]